MTAVVMLTKIGVYIAASVAMTGAVVMASISPIIIAALISAVGTVVASLLACLNVYISTKILNQAHTNYEATTAARDTARESMEHLATMAEATDATDATHTEGD